MYAVRQSDIGNGANEKIAFDNVPNSVYRGYFLVARKTVNVYFFRLTEVPSENFVIYNAIINVLVEKNILYKDTELLGINGSKHFEVHVYLNYIRTFKTTTVHQSMYLNQARNKYGLSFVVFKVVVEL